ncbi:ClpV1 family T6SS ATPase [Photobacterium jeanii]|uniref:ClpV1 family T6SS ATPase n=1 Tax=Photobacterium jeanii TaxID=858640 RepID=A0A178K167_9GAMM|nr:type VI secretion system ATPase TssH [Photobacterium jeanii]OAN11068.1 ClpV1 family T6SS ATPase [Photobacterium jeanii]PST90582.1 type VI secretion system ATPase TssH [Photobacterium jeanii]
MSTMTLKALVDKLTPEAKRTLESSAALANSRSHASVELLHWLYSIGESGSAQYQTVSQFFGIDQGRLKHDLLIRLEQLPTGCADAPGLAIHTVTLLRQAWLAATIEFNATELDIVHLLYAMFADDSLTMVVGQYSVELEKIEPNKLVHAWDELSQQAASASSIASTSSHSSPALEQFTIDLTAQAHNGEIDPIVGRDDEIRQMIDILSRRRQNNPILTGEAGVGKTAVVEGLALRIAAGDVPDSLKGVVLRSLDLALLQAGAGVKGEFENRLKSVVQEVKSSPVPIIIFIDEAHAMVGSGGQAGQSDAANILKPALARGELRTIAATTWAEYKKYFEKDAALARRFQVVKVDEPSEDKAIVMLRGILPVMEKHHQVTITDKALQAAVKLSHRYISGRQLPDKAVGLLDTACARVAMSQATVPAKLERLVKTKEQLQAEIALLEKESVIGSDHQDAIGLLNNKLRQVEADYEHCQHDWEKEKAQIDKAQALTKQLLGDQEQLEVKAELGAIKTELAENSEPMVFYEVDEHLIAEVVADWTGIPVGRMQADEIEQILTLEEHLKKRVIGQDHALHHLAEVVKISRANLNEENKPNGVFLLSGPSGVGKTESALALAEQIYGSEAHITTINMSEYKEEHKVSLLLGSPPGYVGFGEGGVLTEAVRRKPYSVVLLDEIEKAHPGVQDIFYQVFDKGTIKDGEGRDIDFKNTIIILTSNVGTDLIMQLCEDPELAPTTDGLKDAIQDELLKVFKPAFLGRMNIIPYLPLHQKVLKEIAQLQLNRLKKRFKNNYGAILEADDSVVDYLVDLSNDPTAGARIIQQNLQKTLLPLLSTEILGKLSNNESINKIMVTYNSDNFIVDIE